jgi:hypothetical protein
LNRNCLRITSPITCVAFAQQAIEISAILVGTDEGIPETLYNLDGWGCLLRPAPKRFCAKYNPRSLGGTPEGNSDVSISSCSGAVANG